MTRRDYQLITEVLKDVKYFVDIQTAHKKYNHGKYDSYYIMVNKLSGKLAEDNKAFDRDKFLKDCGVIQ